MSESRYRWTILQDGSLPYRPDGRYLGSLPHACTTTVVWQDGTTRTRETTLIVDPALTDTGATQAAMRLRALGIAPDAVGRFFETHDHMDHVLSPEVRAIGLRPERWDGPSREWPGLDLVGLPGHAPDLRALRFRAAEGEVWIAGDAILDLEYLLAWRAYEPNGYGKDDIIRTYRDVALVLETADLVVPGHAGPIQVTVELLRALVASFRGSARFADECLDVPARLERRLRAPR